MKKENKIYIYLKEDKSNKPRNRKWQRMLGKRLNLFFGETKDEPKKRKQFRKG